MRISRHTVLATCALLALAGGVLFARPEAVRAANVCGSREIWINDVAYGAAAGGVYWDPASSQVWTAERGWHYFAPSPPRLGPEPLWVDQPGYGSVGGGFYWDPTSGQVWVSERGWHVYGAFGCPGVPEPPGLSLAKHLQIGYAGDQKGAADGIVALHTGGYPERVELSGVTVTFVFEHGAISRTVDVAIDPFTAISFTMYGRGEAASLGCMREVRVIYAGFQVTSMTTDPTSSWVVGCPVEG